MVRKYFLSLFSVIALLSLGNSLSFAQEPHSPIPIASKEIRIKLEEYLGLNRVPFYVREAVLMRYELQVSEFALLMEHYQAEQAAELKDLDYLTSYIEARDELKTKIEAEIATLRQFLNAHPKLFTPRELGPVLEPLSQDLMRHYILQNQAIERKQHATTETKLQAEAEQARHSEAILSIAEKIHTLSQRSLFKTESARSSDQDDSRRDYLALFSIIAQIEAVGPAIHDHSAAVVSWAAFITAANLYLLYRFYGRRSAVEPPKDDPVWKKFSELLGPHSQGLAEAATGPVALLNYARCEAYLELPARIVPPVRP